MTWPAKCRVSGLLVHSFIDVGKPLLMHTELLGLPVLRFLERVGTASRILTVGCVPHIHE